MRLYRPKFSTMEKVAGSKISQNPQQWAMEVRKALVSQHPYVDDHAVDTKVNHLDPEKKRAFGVVIVHGKVAVLFSIRPNETSRQVELDPLDVMFVPNHDGSDGQFRHINESSFKEAIHQDSIGEVYPKSNNPYSKLPPGNEYIGDMTGDVTPMEWSGYPNAFGGSGAMRTAGSGLLSNIIQNQNQLSRLVHLLDNNHGINRAATSLGLRDSLENLAPNWDVKEDPFNRPSLVHLRRNRANQLFVDFDGGESQPISAVELESILQDDFRSVMSRVMSNGWAILRSFPTVRTPEVPMFSTSPSPVEDGGWYRIGLKDGDMARGLVCSQMVDFDGSRIYMQKAIVPDGRFCEGKALSGVPTEPCNVPFGVPRSGSIGCFLDTSTGFVATPTIKVIRTTETPDQGTIIEAVRLDNHKRIGLVMVDDLLRPQKVDGGHYDIGVVPKESYYFPTFMDFIQLNSDPLRAVDMSKPGDLRGVVDDRPQATLMKNANLYNISGQIHGGKEVYEMNMDPARTRVKLAQLGADDYVIKLAMDMDSGSMKLRGLRPHSFKMKKAANLEPTQSMRYAVSEIRKNAEDAMGGYDEAMQSEEAAPMEDPQVLDSILSLQFISDENLRDIVDSDGLFASAEDKLARMLMAARQGEVAIHEKGVRRALTGIGEARKSIKTLAIELESRDQ